MGWDRQFISVNASAKATHTMPGIYNIHFYSYDVVTYDYIKLFRNQLFSYLWFIDLRLGVLNIQAFTLWYNISLASLSPIRVQYATTLPGHHLPTVPIQTRRTMEVGTVHCVPLPSRAGAAPRGGKGHAPICGFPPVAWYPEVQTPPLNLQKNFVLCACKIYFQALLLCSLNQKFYTGKR